ncbi:MAG: FimB/Mfa2 family fimbrial subunit [Prevotellaceae bacterium]|nr:FimB/Mfa2 family fimbrial subunit [Candidatus Colivivens caballi]
MKQVILSILAILCLASCEKAEIGGESQRKTMSRLEFSAFATSITDYDTRASLTGAKCATLDFVIFDEQGNRFYSVQQDSTSKQFGQISVTDIPYGTYSVVAIASDSKSNTHANIYSPEQADFGGKVPDTFCKYLELTVNSETQITQQMDMARITSMFQLISTDTKPEGIDTIHFQVTGGSTSFSPKTGLAPTADITARDVVSDLKEFTGKRISRSFNTFLPANEANLSIVASLHDNGTVRYSYSLPSVKMKVNCQTIYTGALFVEPSGSYAPTFTVNNKYDNTFNYTF